MHKIDYLIQLKTIHLTSTKVVFLLRISGAYVREYELSLMFLEMNC